MGDRNATLASRLARKLKLLGWTVTTAESCTGGMLTSSLTDISGASIWFRQGWVTYSNEAKMKELGVAPENFKGDTVPGAVSFPVAFGMAQGAVRRSGADIGISITGIAGPGGGTEAKPVGLAFVCAYNRQADAFLVRSTKNHEGDRSTNKQLFVSLALETALNLIEGLETGHLSMDVRKDTGDDEDSDSEDTISLDAGALAAFGRVPGMEDAWFGEVRWSEEEESGVTVVEELKRKEPEDIWSEE